jgi:hypothetical protein
MCLLHFGSQDISDLKRKSFIDSLYIYQDDCWISFTINEKNWTLPPVFCQCHNFLITIFCHGTLKILISHDIFLWPRFWLVQLENMITTQLFWGCRLALNNTVESSTIFHSNLMLCINWFYEILVVIHIIIIVTHETIAGQVPVHNNIWSSLWFRMAILSSPFYNVIVPTFLSTGDDMTVPSSSNLLEPLQHMQVTFACSPHAWFSITMNALILSSL